MPDDYTVYFATNRDFNDSLTDPKFGNRFNLQGPQVFRVGYAKVKKVDEVKYTYSSAVVEEENREKVGSSTLFLALKDTLKEENRDIIIYIHGFASTFELSMERAAQLSHEYVITPWLEDVDRTGQPYRPAVFAFSWPSNGNLFPWSEYHSDRDDAQASGIAMARALLKLLYFLMDLRDQDKRIRREMELAPDQPMQSTDRVSCKQHIHLVTHSMGAWALRHAVNRFADEETRRPLPRIFEHVFLMAADEDDDTFEDKSKLALLPDLAKFVHVYHSRSDRALDVSDVTKGNPNRLGESGPRNMESIMDRVDAIDCTKVDFTSFGDGNHQYYRLRSEVIEDIRQVISGVPSDKITGRTRTSRPRSWRIEAISERKT